MAKMVQIRDMPDEVHRRLKVRASHAGMTLSAYLLSELEDIARRPTPDEVLARLAGLEPVRVGVDEIVDAVRSGRQELASPAPGGPAEGDGDEPRLSEDLEEPSPAGDEAPSPAEPGT